MYNQIPYSMYNPANYSSLGLSASSNSLLGLGKKAFSWDIFLNNAQRTLNVINQAMPIYNQVKPMFKNVGTVFRVIGELNSNNNVNNVNNNNSSNAIQNNTNNNPTFFA